MPSGWTVGGRTAVITGASTGIGRETAIALARLGVRLVLVGRSPAKHEAVLAEMATAGAQASFIECELADLGSVGRAATRVGRGHPEISILVNNAGMGGRRGVTNDGFELAFGVNYLAHYLLTRKLLPILEAADLARIVNLSSNAHHSIKSFDSAAGRGKTRSLTGLAEYSHSKAAMVAFTLELARRLDGTTIRAYAVHPGLVSTEGWRAVPPPFRWVLTRRMIPASLGAVPVVEAVVNPELPSGTYLTPEGPRPPHRLVEDPILTAAFWEQSERWVSSFLV